MKKELVSCMGLSLLGLCATAQATLIDRGNGMIYDTDQDLTWLQDANYAKTSGYDADGRMPWNQAMAWADGLSFGGYDDWRLPTVIDTGALGMNWAFSGTDSGYNVDTSTSELAYMFHVNLGNESWFNKDGSRNEDGCSAVLPTCTQHTSADGVDILNLQSLIYWSGTEEYAPPLNFNAWGFSTDWGAQGTGGKANALYAWAVRSGDVAAASVPEPGTFALMMAGLVGLGIARRKQATNAS
jgi:hypothetical protein